MFANHKILRQIVLPLTTVLTIAANVGIDAIQLNNVTTAKISDSFPNLFVPAGYVFAVWGVIYLAIIAYSIFQALPSQLENPRLRNIAPLYLLSCVANALWLTLFHYFQFGLAMILIVGLLLCLIGCYRGLGVGQIPVSTRERWLAHLPFSIYLGWVSVATIANATQLLVFLRWGGFGLAQEFWAIAMVIVAALLGLFIFITSRDAAYLLVLAWAFTGIGNKQAALPALATTAWLATGIMVFLAAIALFRKTNRAQPKLFNA